MTLSGLASWAAALRLDDVTPDARTALEDVLANLLAVTAGGHGTPAMRRLVDVWDPAPGPCTLVGVPAAGVTVEAAAWLNSAAAVRTELDDGNRFAAGHPAALSLFGVLAQAEATGASGSKLLEALVVAYEVSARIGRATTLAADVHTHGTLGAPGTAAGCAVLADAGADVVERAVRTALGGLVATSWTPVLAGSDVRDTWAGTGAVAGLAAARVARAGWAAPGTGMPPAVGDLGPEQLVPVGTDLLLAHGYLKQHAACAYTHAPADAALAVRERLAAAGRDLDDVTSITVATAPAGARLAARRWSTPHGAHFSTPFAVASALVHGDVAPHRSDPLRAPAVYGVADRVELETVEPGDPGTRPARVRLTLDDGTVLEAAVDHPAGDRDLTPFDAADRRRLLTQALAAGASRVTADDVADVVRSLADAPRCDEPLARLRPRPTTRRNHP
ncbi:MmgE/PrpD family protein [Isoptericola haloaureus]|uniref:MmgE/PrpD family protein n=1 Tax=Isoptericola haloaureus TaxID=1542902 RepID=A0ABU7Z4I4_9MICO